VLTVAPGGTGKSSVIAVEALAMATGRTLLQDKPHHRARVWLWNGEDPADELQRRITAAAMHYKIAPEAFADHLFVDSGRQTKMVIARAERNGVTIASRISARQAFSTVASSR
jgi:RecA-family ATPase